MLATIEAHWSVLALPMFTIASLLLNFLAQAWTALGKTAPGWVGTASTIVGKILHFLNGNTAAATAPATTTVLPLK